MTTESMASVIVMTIYASLTYLAVVTDSLIPVYTIVGLSVMMFALTIYALIKVLNEKD